ncbi:hypothetical protein AB3G45_26900 [Shinella sp. S4-D37]|uniref:hypothetical protein n=1 Tax=Shinella sp. S4-D37 TaxID=3161999 RepID=UPI003466694F
MHDAKTQLMDLADRLARLAPSHRDPHRFHEEKSELVAELRRLAVGGSNCATNEDRNGAYRLASGKVLEAANDNHPRRTARMRRMPETFQ